MGAGGGEHTVGRGAAQSGSGTRSGGGAHRAGGGGAHSRAALGHRVGVEGSGGGAQWERHTVGQGAQGQGHFVNSSGCTRWLAEGADPGAQGLPWLTLLCFPLSSSSHLLPGHPAEPSIWSTPIPPLESGPGLDPGPHGASENLSAARRPPGPPRSGSGPRER